MFPGWQNIFHDEESDLDPKKQLGNDAKSVDSAIQGSFAFDADDYDDDGNLRSALDARQDSYLGRRTIYAESMTYGQTSKSVSGSLSDRYKKWFNNTVDWVTGGSKKDKFFKRELTAVARAINSVRNFGGNRDQSIEVKWARDKEKNNQMKSSNQLFLSPDIVDEKHTLQPDWTEDQRRDALIGEALTLLGLKRISDSSILKEIIKQADRDRQRITQINQMRGFENVDIFPYEEALDTVVNEDLLRMYSSLLWRAVEQDAARNSLLKEYRGSKGYFAAIQAYYCAKSVLEDLLDSVQHFCKPDLEEIEKVGISVAACRTLIWNLNNSLNPANQVPLRHNEFGLVVDEANTILEQAITEKNTAARYNLCYDAALKIAELEPNIGQPKGEQGELQQQLTPEEQRERKKELLKKIEDLPPSGQGDVPVFEVPKNSDDHDGKQDIDDLEDEAIEGLTDASENCRIIDVEKCSLEALQEYRRMNQPLLAALKRRLEPCSEKNVIDEHGLRSGRLSHNALWKVGTDLVDNDRVFHRRLQLGFSKEMTLVLLVDFSGSMSGQDICSAKQVAVLVHDALEMFPQVRFEVWGHEGSYNHNNIYRFKDISALAAKRCGGGTDEGGAYACVAKELIKTSKITDRKVLMAIGDGHTDRDKVSNAVNWAKRGGVETLDLLIGGEDRRRDAEAAYGKGNVILIGNDDDVALHDEILRIVQPWLVNTISKLYKQSI